MSRLCGADGLTNVVSQSTFRNRDFHHKCDVDIVDGPRKGLAARTVVVLEESNNVLHAQLVPEIANAPVYDSAPAALK